MFSLWAERIGGAAKCLRVVLITVKQILPDAAENLIELFMESFVCGE